MTDSGGRLSAPLCEFSCCRLISQLFSASQRCRPSQSLGPPVDSHFPPVCPQAKLCAIPSLRSQPFKPVPILPSGFPFLILPSGFPLSFIKKPLRRHRPQALTLTVNTGAARLCDSIGRHPDPFSTGQPDVVGLNQKSAPGWKSFGGMGSP